MSKSGGVFQIDDVTRTMSKGGGCAWCSTHPSSDPPPPGWLATGLINMMFDTDDKRKRDLGDYATGGMQTLDLFISAKHII